MILQANKSVNTGRHDADRIGRLGERPDGTQIYTSNSFCFTTMQIKRTQELLEQVRILKFFPGT